MAAKSTLIKQWSTGGKDYRLLKGEAADYYRKEQLFIETDEKDALGDPRWTPVYAWIPSADTVGAGNEHNLALNALAELVRSYVRAEATPQVQAPAVLKAFLPPNLTAGH